MPLMGNIQAEPPPGYRGRYDGPPFDDIPPGVEPPVPGFEPSPFEKPPFGPTGPIERDRMPPPNYRDPYRPPFVEGPGPGYRDMPMAAVQNEIPVHVGEQPPRYRDNYRPGPYRDQGPMPFRDGQPFREAVPQPPYRDGPVPPRDFRGAPPQFRDSSYRNHPYRDGAFRENPPHSFRDGAQPFRPPSTDPRESIPANYHDPNFRDGFRDETASREHMRPGYRPPNRSRGGSRRNPNLEHERHRERDVRERERYNENRDPSERVDRPRDDKRTVLEKGRDGREDRSRDYDRSREYEKERERDFERTTPDKKLRSSPKRSREGREKKRSESRGRSRDRERDGKRDKKEERMRDKSSADRSKEHKEKEKKEKPKDRKKKKREKEKDTEKKKKRDKKEKKDKDSNKKEDESLEKVEEKIEDLKESDTSAAEKQSPVNNEQLNTEDTLIKTNNSPKVEKIEEQPKDDLYDDEAAEAIDKEIIQNYIKTEENEPSADKSVDIVHKEEPFDGIELQATADELDLKADIEGPLLSKEMLAPLPALSKWEVDEENIDKAKEPGELTSPDEEEDGGKVTSEVIKRAENAIFAKAISSLRPIEIKKISSDRLKLYNDESQPKSSIQITVPLTDTEHRSIEINDRKRRYSKTPPPRLSVKDRLGGKVEDIRRARDSRVVQSTVERVKSRSKTPKKEQPYRRVTVDRERSRKSEGLSRNETPKDDRRIVSECIKPNEKHRGRSPIEITREYKKKETDKGNKPENKPNSEEKSDFRSRAHQKIVSSDDKNLSADRERKKSTLDEAHFEPDYDENVESDNETKEDLSKKRERSSSPIGPTETKKPKFDTETIKLDLTNVKKKPDSESESSSSEDSSSSSSSDARKRKKKKKKSKKKKKRAASDSDSDSDSSSDDHKKKKKKRKHKKKSSKKKKKSKHK